MSALDPILRIVDRLSVRMDGKPDLRWAVVTQISPLRIRLDADEQDLLATPDTLVSPLLPGERVRVALQNRRVTVLGVAGRRTDLRGTTAQREALALSGASVPGLKFFDESTGREYVWNGSEFQGDTDWVDISTHILATYRNTCLARRRGGVIEILFNAGSASIPVGNTTLGTLPSVWAPGIGPNRRGAAFFGGGYTGVFYLAPTGEFGVSQQTGAARNQCQGHMIFGAD